MRLTTKARNKIIRDKIIRAELCAAFDLSYDTIQRLLHENKPDSKLTTIKAIEIIKEGTGLTQEEILTSK